MNEHFITWRQKLFLWCRHALELFNQPSVSPVLLWLPHPLHSSFSNDLFSVLQNYSKKQRNGLCSLHQAIASTSGIQKKWLGFTVLRKKIHSTQPILYLRFCGKRPSNFLKFWEHGRGKWDNGKRVSSKRNTCFWMRNTTHTHKPNHVRM